MDVAVFCGAGADFELDGNRLALGEEIVVPLPGAAGAGEFFGQDAGTAMA